MARQIIASDVINTLQRNSYVICRDALLNDTRQALSRIQNAIDGYVEDYFSSQPKADNPIVRRPTGHYTFEVVLVCWTAWRLG